MVYHNLEIFDLIKCIFTPRIDIVYVLCNKRNHFFLDYVNDNDDNNNDDIYINFHAEHIL